MRKLVARLAASTHRRLGVLGLTAVLTGVTAETAGSLPRWAPRFWIVLLVGSGACLQALSTAPDGDRLKIGGWGGDS